MKQVYTMQLSITADEYEEIFLALDYWLDRNADEEERCEDIRAALTSLQTAWQEEGD